jgi:hypothetical protein
MSLRIRIRQYAGSLFNPLNAELNPICHLLALLGARPILHISGVRVKKKTSGLRKIGWFIHCPREQSSTDKRHEIFTCVCNFMLDYV